MNRVHLVVISLLLCFFIHCKGAPLLTGHDAMATGIVQCGFHQSEEQDENLLRKKRYIVQGSRWHKSKVSYKISSYIHSISKYDTDIEIHRAVKLWNNLADVELTPTTGNADIDISFVPTYHGDGHPFPRGILAHAYYPKYGGDIHLNYNWDYTFNSSTGVNLFAVVAHEIGHSLGLKHTTVPGAIMSYAYVSQWKHLKLHPDDVKGLQNLYGQPEAKIKVCYWQTLDAVINLPWPYYNTTYFFSGLFYWTMDSASRTDTQIHRINSHWRIPSDIDAALDFADRSTVVYFFKGSKYWKIDTKDMQKGVRSKPKRLGVDGFYGIPAAVDSAFLWAADNRIYFTKGSTYYRLSQRYMGNPHAVERYHKAPGYPRALSRWRGLPTGGVDAAVRLPDRNTYFFRDYKYYKHNTRTFKVVKNYPMSIPQDWLKCIIRA